MIIDTSGLLSALDPDDVHHVECAEALRAMRSRVVSPFVLAEVDYLVNRDLGVDASIQVLSEVVHGAYDLATFDRVDVAAAAGVIDQYRDLGVGLADASLVVLAARHDTNEILTLDERHFRAMTALDGEPFRLLPADR